MWGMTGDQTYDLIDSTVFALFLLAAMLIYGFVWSRHDPCDCACACADDYDEESDNVKTDMPEAPSPVVGLSVPGTEGDQR